MRSVLFVLAALAIAGGAAGFAIEVEAHDEECFFYEAKSGTKMGLNFQVAEGGFLDIDVEIRGPDDKIIYNGERESDGKYTFTAHMDGRYTYCFSNEMSTVTPKLVVFSLTVAGDSAFVEDSGDDKHDKLHQMIAELSESIVTIKREQDYMMVRERTHRMINDSTNSRVVYWSFFEALLLVVMSLGQVYYINRFFEVKQRA
eukprot:m.354714 g.354714  ORF g.354714 m.354714 type:complete len:201 (-) comp17086_c0_seq1:186-788(-)